MANRNEITEPRLRSLECFLAKKTPELSPLLAGIRKAGPVEKTKLPGMSVENEFAVAMQKADGQAILAALEAANDPQIPNSLWVEYDGTSLHVLIGLWRGCVDRLSAD